jgi:hypothetical protein
MAGHSLEYVDRMKLLFVSYYSQSINIRHLAVISFRSLQTTRLSDFLLSRFSFTCFYFITFIRPSTYLVAN